MSAKRIAFELKNHLSELNRLWRTLEKFGKPLGLSPRGLHEINLVLEELFTNIIAYGFEDSAEHRIRIEITRKSDRLHVRIEDDGRGFNPLGVLPPDLKSTMENRKIGGLGLLLIKRFVEDIHYERNAGKNILTFRKHIT